MNKIINFEDLDCWKKSRELANFVYDSLKNCKDFWFKDQIQRAAVSGMNNIAEWFGRWNKKEKIQFFNIANGSLFEVRSMLYLAKDQQFISDEMFTEGILLTIEAVKTLQGFLRYIHTQNSSVKVV